MANGWIHFRGELVGVRGYSKFDCSGETIASQPLSLRASERL
jgi:hypothetical protein